MNSRPLAIDFAPAGAATFRPVRWIILLTGLLLTIVVARADLIQNRRLEAMRADLNRIEARRHPELADPVVHDPAIERQIKRASSVLDDLELPWEPLFAAVEGAGPTGLGLLGLAPDAPTKALHITGQARTLDDVLRYIDRLNQQPLLQEVHLISYAQVQHNAEPAIQFTIGAKWKRS